uniref:WAP four-disulfide core domain protein 1 n=1 Tax=Cyprinus carpio TaxID=7962 RepID=A0A8C1L761_CYPCA
MCFFMQLFSSLWLWKLSCKGIIRTTTGQRHLKHTHTCFRKPQHKHLQRDQLQNSEDYWERRRRTIGLKEWDHARLSDPDWVCAGSAGLDAVGIWFRECTHDREEGTQSEGMFLKAPMHCEVPGCRSDSECERHKRCCYNGCIYACLESVQPPPVLDWLVQPKPRWLGGNGWLLDGPEEVLQAEACSTTEDGDEPLLCPTGYECHIINPGNPSAGIPNRGQCIKQRGNSGSNSNNAVSYEKHQHKNLG